jgi:AraC-like DNA-binding protein
MNPSPGASAQLILTHVSHTIRTATIRDDLVGWVISGRKRLSTPFGDTRFRAGEVFLIPRSTQWDVVNEAAPGGHYEARLMSFAPQLVERFHDRFGQFAATPALQSCAGTAADDAFVATLGHATAALHDPEASHAMREHRALEVLLLLAERGLVFAPARGLGWADRVHRLIGQRPHARWTVDAVASAFHLSASTLQRRLADEGASVSRCVREVRLEAAMALLQGSGLQVSEIASRCGYDSHSRFSAAFRQRFGYAPSDLRP